MSSTALPQTSPAGSPPAGAAPVASPLCLSTASFWPPLHVVESAWLEHAPFAFWLVEAAQPRSLVELGTHNGFSFLAFCQAVQRLGLSTACYAVDTWQGDEHAGFYGEEVHAQLAATVGRHYAGFTRMLRCRFDQALPHFADGSIDLLHIDGRHTYEDVIEDFESWRPKLSDRAVVLFHDTNVRERDFGVWKFWHALSQQYPSFEFLHGHGLGVLALGPDIPERLRPLLQATPEAVNAIRASYAHLGNGISHRYQLELAHRQLGEAGLEQDRLRAELAAQASHIVLREAAEAAAQAEAERLRAVQREAEAALALAQAELATLESQNALLRQQAEEQHQALQELRDALAERDSTHAALQSAFSGLSAQAAETQLSLGQMQQSTFWRATGPLRSGLAQIPQPVRMLLRRSAKAAWWAVTPHRIPARLAFLRTRKQLGERMAVKTIGREYVYRPPQRPEDLEQRIAALPRRPLFSVVVPIYNTPPDLLALMAQSVLAQWYQDWELILADDASPDAGTREALGRLDDPRIRVLSLPTNSGISGTTNAALAGARGDYVVFLDHDDELTVDCLWELALRIGQDDPDFLYSDEDKLDGQGRFCQPFFKPDWSPDAMMSTMFTCHVSCVRRTLLEQVGGLDSSYDGAQDWDLVLRLTERTERIAHIPKVLYHWRIIPASTAADLNAKPYAIQASVRARQDALKRRGLEGTLEPVEQVPGFYRVRYAVQGCPLLSIIIPSRNNGPVLQRCIESLHITNTWQNFEVIILDNGSDQPETLEILQDLSAMEKVSIIRHDAPFNYSELNNIGVRASRGKVLLFLNDDTEILTPDALERMIGYAQQQHVGAVGAKLLYPSTKQVQHTGVINLPTGPSHAFLQEDADSPGYFMRALVEYNWIAVTGACLMMERAKFDAIGGFDEDFPVAYNDVELCFRLVKAKLYNVVCMAARLLHHESLSRGIDHETPERMARLNADRQRLYDKHPEYVGIDPFFNPNLDQGNVGFLLPLN